MWPTLKRRGQFERVYSQGKKRSGDLLVLFHLDEPLGEPQVAFVASRKVGGAVQRNRAKRVLRAAFLDVMSSQSLRAGWWVLVARRPILEHKSHEVAEQLRALVGQLDGR